ncbi:MAG: MetS family NSS transporter small subunit [Microthrixaceae bacterium]|nr:MetS family NSS transporter small subunit [Microthrixaceae bacterium]
MTPIALVALVLALTLVWGGLIASAIALRIRPELAAYPPGGEDRPGEDLE